MRRDFAFRTSGVAVALMLACGPVLATDVVAIVNKANANAVDKAFVAKAFTATAKTWPDGSSLVLVDQGEDNPIRAAFNQSVLGKNNANLKAMWAQLVFSGRAAPPKTIDGDADVKKFVASNKNAIGYVSPGAVDDSVKAVK